MKEEIDMEEEEDSSFLEPLVHIEVKEEPLDECPSPLTPSTSYTPRDFLRKPLNTHSVCAMGHCKSPSGVSYHIFPKDLEMRGIWRDLCGPDGKFTTSTPRVCGSHFTEEDYERDLRGELMGIPKVPRLKKNAFPRVNLSPSAASKILPMPTRRTETLEEDKLQSSLSYQAPMLKKDANAKLKCAIPSCHSPNGVSYHRFPHKDPDLLAEWIVLCGLDKKKGIVNPRFAKVCQLHFTKESFKVNKRFEALGIPYRNEINENAKPTLHLGEDDPPEAKKAGPCCAVLGCGGTDEEPFFGFPSDDIHALKAWLGNISSLKRGVSSLSCARICMKHFSHDSFEREVLDGKILALRLKKDAVPSLHLADSSVDKPHNDDKDLHQQILSLKSDVEKLKKRRRGSSSKKFSSKSVMSRLGVVPPSRRLVRKWMENPDVKKALRELLEEKKMTLE